MTLPVGLGIADAAVDANGDELIRGDYVTLDGRPQEIVGIVDFVGRTEIGLRTGLWLNAAKYVRVPAPYGAGLDEADERTPLSPASPSAPCAGTSNGEETMNEAQSKTAAAIVTALNGDTAPLEAIVEKVVGKAAPSLLAASLQDPATAAVLPTLKREQLEHMAKHLHITFSGVTKPELIERIAAQLPKTKGGTGRTTPKASAKRDVTPNFKGSTATASKPAKAEPKATASKPAKTDKPAAAGGSCELCGFSPFRDPKRTRCASTSACKARQEGRSGRGRPAGTSSKTDRTSAAQRKVADVAAGKAEAKALREWKAAGSKGKAPATPVLDRMNGLAAAS